MTFEPTATEGQYLPTDIIIPDNQADLELFLDTFLKKVADIINAKDNGFYNIVEQLNNQQYFTDGDPQNFRPVYRKIINFGALPNSATTSVAHGISTTEDYKFTRIYGTATDPAASSINSAIPLPYTDPAALANGIELNIDSTNVNIKTAADYSSYTTCYVVLEYVKTT